MKRALLITLLVLLSTLTISAQTFEEDIFVTADEMPTFQGGDLSEFCNWVYSNIKYPQEALEKGIQGYVVVKFVVEKDGTISNFQVLQSPDKTLSDAVVEVLQKSPTWNPAKQNNKLVRVTYTLPVLFKFGSSNTDE